MPRSLDPVGDDRKRGYDAMCELTERLADMLQRVKGLLAIARHEKRDVTVDELQRALGGEHD